MTARLADIELTGIDQNDLRQSAGTSDACFRYWQFYIKLI